MKNPGFTPNNQKSKGRTAAANTKHKMAKTSDHQAPQNKHQLQEVHQQINEAHQLISSNDPAEEIKESLEEVAL